MERLRCIILLFSRAKRLAGRATVLLLAGLHHVHVVLAGAKVVLVLLHALQEQPRVLLALRRHALGHVQHAAAGLVDRAAGGSRLRRRSAAREHAADHADEQLALQPAVLCRAARAGPYRGYARSRGGDLREDALLLRNVDDGRLRRRRHRGGVALWRGPTSRLGARTRASASYVLTGAGRAAGEGRALAREWLRGMMNRMGRETGWLGGSRTSGGKDLQIVQLLLADSDFQIRQHGSLLKFCAA